MNAGQARGLSYDTNTATSSGRRHQGSRQRRTSLINDGHVMTCSTQADQHSRSSMPPVVRTALVYSARMPGQERSAVASAEIQSSDASIRSGIVLRGVTKRFGTQTVVRDVDLEIQQGEFFTMLGPSGSGKTTLLRLIAGFERLDSGTISLGGTDVTFLPPYQRDVNTVFQDYALFPHYTVAQNVNYGLRVRKVPREQATQRVESALEMVQMLDFAKRKPAQLRSEERRVGKECRSRWSPYH